MTYFSIWLNILPFLSFILLSALYPSHWIIRSIHRTLYLTYLSLYLILRPSKKYFQPIPYPIHQTTREYSTLTATQRVLSMPELVSEILKWDAGGYKKDHWTYNQTFSKTRFSSYARVNRLWFYEAMRYLWWTPQPYTKLQALQKLPRARKQIYANFMVELSFENDVQNSSRENRILKRLSFPRLRFARLDIRSGQRLLSLPDIKGRVLENLTIDVKVGDDSKGGAMSDRKMRIRLAKRLKVGFLNMRVLLISPDYLYRRCFPV